MGEILYAVEGMEENLKHDTMGDAVAEWLDDMADAAEVAAALEQGVAILAFRADKPDAACVAADLADHLHEYVQYEVTGECDAPGDDAVAALESVVRAYLDKVGAIVPVKVSTTVWSAEALKKWAKENGYV